MNSHNSGQRIVRATILLVLWTFGVASGLAQSDYKLGNHAVSTAAPDPAIAAALGKVSEARVRQTIEKLVSFKTRSTLSSMETDLPPGQGVTAAADWIFAQFEEISKECGGCLEVKRDTFTNPVMERVARPTTITNVYAVLRGSGNAAQAKRMYLVTGHYDSRNSKNENDHDAAPGANDDASGVAVSLECARVLSGMKFPATLVFVAVAGEEQGLYGSGHLAKLAKDEGWQLEGVLNNDIVGGNTTPGDALQRKDVVRVFSEGIATAAKEEQTQKPRRLGSVQDSEDAPSRQVARAMADVGRTYLGGEFAAYLVARPDRYLRGGDHSSFNKEGFAAVRITEWREDFNHQHQDVRVENGVQFGDLLQFVDFGYVAKVAKLNAATLATLAASPGIPRDVKIVAKQLENGTTLTWKAPEGAPAGFHYELLWRETTVGDWQYAQNVAGSETTINVPVSKDNVIFGVRAVDAAGHRGLAVTP
jgi:Peptidase family M28